MRLEIHVHVHNHSTALEVKIDRILHLQERTMAIVDELKAELVAINEATNEIAADVDKLLTFVTEGGVSAADAQELKSALVALKGRLQGVAAAYTPEVPVEEPPVVEG